MLEAHAKQYFEIIDRDRDGFVTFNEFLTPFLYDLDNQVIDQLTQVKIDPLNVINRVTG